MINVNFDTLLEAQQYKSQMRGCDYNCKKFLINSLKQNKQILIIS